MAVLFLSWCASARADTVRSISHRDRLYDVASSGGSLFVVGHPGRLLRSKDGGATFENLKAPKHQEALFSIAFNAKGEGAIVGRSGFVLVTLDKGETWTASLVQFDEEKPGLFGVDVLPDGSIVAVGEFGAIARSEDHGKSWKRSSYSVDMPAAEGQPEKASAQCPSLGAAEEDNEGAIEEARLTDVHFVDANNGFAVGEFGLVLHTEDGGRTFKRQNGCTGQTLYGLALIGPSRAVAAGAEGTVVETLDAGATWAVRETGTTEHLFGIYANAKRTIVLGAAGTLLVRSEDGPFKAAKTNVHTWLASAWLDEKGHGLIVGGRAYLLRTQDGGNTQQRIFGE
jgi:photosystem II stability/assembly factor-like uncharacterized protein